ncbi:hypothetical protein EDD18DRAFT_1113773 [Armillaria luteobubalina]|uniref:BTB domain-containing protein n=1 Tax=Armillaria luteobubalina TaxID=153913 RepID=A0AA39P9Q4_9AGAR|nr:hypothetical protein EDD18DRAFT_1113773 [Armillaria luteobubalina]
MAQDLAAAYRPMFNAPDTDAILSSLDGTLYRVPSSLLQRTTTFFMSPSFTFGPNGKPVPIHKHDAVLERLLRIISGLAIPPWCTFDDLEGVLSLAGTFGWDEEAELASRHTLDLSLHQEQHQEALRRIPVRALVKLFKFHRKCRDEFQEGGGWRGVGGAGVKDVLGDGRVAVWGEAVFVGS